MGLKFCNKDKTALVELEGDMRRFDNPKLAQRMLACLRSSEKVEVRAANLTDWDSTTAAIVYKIMRKVKGVKLVDFPQGLANTVHLALKIDRKPYIAKPDDDFFANLGEDLIERWQGLRRALVFMRRTAVSFWRLLSARAVIRSADWIEALADNGYRALGIVMLASFMTGLILAFVGALQLRLFGAQVYIASLVTIAMVRIMGAIMMGIIMAGRTGAQMAAVIGSMKVNEELDALQTFGLEAGDIVVMPRLVSLALSCPFLTIFADLAGIVGGLLAAVAMFDISPAQYLLYAKQAFAMRDFIIGVVHGGIYGIIIAACGCYFGINCGRDARSVGDAATKAVVSAIVIMIVATGALTWIIEGIGI